jgi:hypothetical protein
MRFRVSEIGNGLYADARLVRESDRHPGILHHPAKPKIDDALVQNVCLWRKEDMPVVLRNVRFWG